MDIFRSFFVRLIILAAVTAALLAACFVGDHTEALAPWKSNLRKAVRVEAKLRLELRKLRLQYEDKNWILDLREKIKLDTKITALEESLAAARIAREEAENALLEARQNTVSTWDRHGKRVFILAVIIVFFLPILHKILMYWVFASWVNRLKPMHDASGKFHSGTVHAGTAQAALDVPVPPGQTLLLRAGGWGKKRVHTRSRTRMMWSWRYPLVSFAADLFEMVEFLPEGENASVTVTAPAPDIFVSQMDLNGGGMVLRPRYLVGISGDVQIRIRWNFRLHNLLAGHIRQIILSGTGRILVAGAWGVDAVTGDDSKVESPMLLGYEAGSLYALCRTETFWHYLRGKTELFDRKLAKGLFLTQNAPWDYRKTGETFLERTVNALLNGVGSFFGF